MKFNQFFENFYFKFIFLINQFSNYLKQTKINNLKNKITFKLQNKLIFYKSEHALLFKLKTMLQKINQRFNNVRQATFFDLKSRYFKHFLNVVVFFTFNAFVILFIIVKHFSIFFVFFARVFSSIEKKAYFNVAKQLNNNNC